MALLTLADLRSLARDAMRDTDSNNYAIDATTLDRLINKAYIAIRGGDDTRPKYLNATTTGLTLALNDKSKVINASANVRRVLDVFEASTVNATAPAATLERAEPYEILALQAASVGVTAQPTHYAVTRDGGASGQWLVLFYKTCDAARYYCIRALVEPTALSAVGDKPDVDDQDGYAIADMAALVGGGMMGLDPVYLSAIEKRIPAVHQQALGQMRAELLNRQESV